MRWIIILSLLLLLDGAYASPEITSWYNNKTGNASPYMGITAGDTVSFNVSSNETVNWTWKLDEVEQEIDLDTNQGLITFTFPSYGTYHVSVSGSNVNGSTQTVNWTVTSTLNFTDALGNNISVTEKPQRIVSLAPSNTEILFALGLGGRVVGVTSYCDYPPEAAGKEKVGGFSNPSVELVVNLTPDLILAHSANDLTVVSQLIQDCENLLNCTLVSLKAETIDEIIENIELVGKITDVDARNLTFEITRRINAVESNTSILPEEQKLKVLYTVGYGWTAGNGTFADDLIQKAGGKNIASDSDGWYVISQEVVLLRNPELIICSGMGGSGVDICNNIKNDDALKYVDAVVNNSLYVIGDSNIIERPGPRIATGLETVHALLNFPEGEVDTIPVQITSPLPTSYEQGSTITLSFTSNATISFYRLDGGFVTSFDNEAATISPSSGSHTITVWVRDASGNWGSDALSFTLKSPQQQSSGGGGGGSSSSSKPTVTTSIGKAVVSVPSISAGSIVSLQIPDAQDVDVTEISIKAKRSVNWAKITIESLDSYPADISISGGVPYRYLNVDTENIEDENIAELIVKFKVEKTWIADNEVGQETLKLKRYSSSRWDELPTIKSREDPTYIYYTANSTGFSYFAIIGEKKVQPVTTSTLPKTALPTTSPPPITLTSTPLPTTVPATTPAASPILIKPLKKKGICGPTIIILVGTLPLILYAQLRRKKL